MNPAWWEPGRAPRQRLLDEHQRHKDNLTHYAASARTHALDSETHVVARRCNASTHDANA